MKRPEKDTLEVMAEKAIYAFNEASRTMYETIKENKAEESQVIKVINRAIRKKKTFKKSYFSAITPGLERDLAEPLIPELETAINTFNKVLEHYTKHLGRSLTQ
jgi:hypothetical protein